MQFNKKIIIIIVIMAVSVGAVFIVNKVTKVSLEDQLKLAIEEFDRAETFEEAEKADKKIYEIRKKMDPDGDANLDASIKGMKEAEKTHPEHKIEFKM